MILPSISVIIPAYSHEKYIRETVNSILRQSFSDFEIIAIDDGSPDKTGEILDECATADTRVKVFHQENCGVAATQNRGLALASGEWVTFCGSDDTLPANALEDMISAGKNADVVIGEFAYRYDDGREVRRSLPRRTLSFTESVKEPGTVWGKLFRRDYLLDNDISFPGLTLEEDVVFLSRLTVTRPSYAVAHKCCYEYWIHNMTDATPLSRRTDYRSFADRLAGQQLIMDAYKDAGWTLEYREQFLHSLPRLEMFFLAIYDTSEREKAYELIKGYILRNVWSDSAFAERFGYTLDRFRSMDAQSFFEACVQEDKKEALLRQYRLGEVGLRYVFKFIREWARYKLKHL